MRAASTVGFHYIDVSECIKGMRIDIRGLLVEEAKETLGICCGSCGVHAQWDWYSVSSYCYIARRNAGRLRVKLQVVDLI